MPADAQMTPLTLLHWNVKLIENIGLNWQLTKGKTLVQILTGSGTQSTPLILFHHSFTLILQPTFFDCSSISHKNPLLFPFSRQQFPLDKLDFFQVFLFNYITIYLYCFLSLSCDTAVFFSSLFQVTSCGCLWREEMRSRKIFFKMTFLRIISTSSLSIQ